MRLAILAFIGIAAAAPQFAYGPPPPVVVIEEDGPRGWGFGGGLLGNIVGSVGDIVGTFLPPVGNLVGGIADVIPIKAVEGEAVAQ